MKGRLVIFFLILVFSFSSTLSVLAEDVSEDVSPWTVTSIFFYTITRDAQVSEIPETLSQLANNFDLVLINITRDDLSKYIEVPLRWNFDDTPTTSGTYTFYADVVIPEDWVFASWVSPQVSCICEFYDDVQEPKIELTRLELNSLLAQCFMIPLGDEEAYGQLIDKIQRYYSTIRATTADSQDWVELVLDSTYGVDIHHEPDLYEILLYYDLKPEDANTFFLPNNLGLLRIPTYIYDPSLLCIMYSHLSDDQIIIKTSEPISDHKAAPVVEYLFGGEKHLTHKELEQGNWQPLSQDQVLHGSDYFALPRSFLALNYCSYYFRLTANERTSNILYLNDYSDEIVYYDAGHIDSGGDRDGGDSDGSEPPEIIQKPPINDNSGDKLPTNNKNDRNTSSSHNQGIKLPSADQNKNPLNTDKNPSFNGNQDTSQLNQSTPDAATDQNPLDGRDFYSNAPKELTPSPQSVNASTNLSVDISSNAQTLLKKLPDEFLGETQDIISGTRLLLMLEGTDAVQFSKQGITLSIPAEVLLDLNIQDTDRFVITIERQSNGELSFGMERNGTAVTSLPGTLVMVPYSIQNDTSQLVLTDQQGMDVMGSYDAALAVVTFTVDHTGFYTISEQHETATSAATPITDRPKESKGVGSIGVALALLGIFFPVAVISVNFLRKRSI